MNKMILILSLICLALSEAAADKGFNFGEDPYHRVERACRFNNPLKDLEWLKNIHRKKPDYSICMYKRNGKVLFKIFRCGKEHFPVYWYDCTGYKICQTMRASCSAVEGARFFKCYYKGCREGGSGETEKCDGTAWFKYPNQGTFPTYSDIYVRVRPGKHQDIASMELYINGKLVRKDTRYPYEWGAGVIGQNDKGLLNLSSGRYKLECRIKTKCGQVNKKYRQFYVK